MPVVSQLFPDASVSLTEDKPGHQYGLYSAAFELLISTLSQTVIRWHHYLFTPRST